MNCQSCNTRIDYRFQTNCVHCGSLIERASLLPSPSIPDPAPLEKKLTWAERVINMGYVLVSSFVGMISGAVVIYFSAIAYLAFVPSIGNPSEECARGNAICMLAILSGGFLGTIGGSVIAILNPLCKGAAK